MNRIYLQIRFRISKAIAMRQFAEKQTVNPWFLGFTTTRGPKGEFCAYSIEPQA